ncbi:uncharacterized protein [Amphiura filiformis]|uniref:uncharacterized protein n=1 Tax=Amphiura filiformis TaxID=82378 RepID=UPI003B21CDD8
MKTFSTILIVVLFATMVAGYPDALTRGTIRKHAHDHDDDAHDHDDDAWEGKLRLCGEDLEDKEFDICGHRHKRDLKDALAFLEDEGNRKRHGRIVEECCRETCYHEELLEIC